MKVTINDNPVDHSFTPQTSFGEVLSFIMNGLIAPGDVISAIFVNNVPLEPGQISLWQDRPLMEFESINVEVLSRQTFAACGLRITARQLLESETARELIVQRIAQGQTGQAMKAMGEYLQMWDHAQQTLASACRLMDYDMEHLCVFVDSGTSVGQEQPVMAFINQLSEQLEQIKASLQAGDYVMLGDILDYEFGGIAQNWARMMEKLALLFDPAE